MKVEGALPAPYDKNYAQKQIFYFCPKRVCISTPPVWSNVRTPLNIVRGTNVTDEELNLLINDV